MYDGLRVSFRLACPGRGEVSVAGWYLKYRLLNRGFTNPFVPDDVDGNADFAGKLRKNSLRALVEEAMKQGAVGFSTGLIYIPGTYSNSDEVAAWPTAEVSFMDPTFAVKIVHGLEPEDEGFAEAFDSMNKASEPWDIAAIYAVQSVIRPEETRDYLIRMLDVHRQRLTGGIGQHLMRAWPTTF